MGALHSHLRHGAHHGVAAPAAVRHAAPRHYALLPRPATDWRRRARRGVPVPLLGDEASTVDLHAFLQRHAELFRTVPKWTVRVLLPPHLCKAQGPYLRALRLELGTRMVPHVADEFRWWCRARKAGAQARLAADAERWTKASRAFASSRFRALYQSWCMLGDYVIDSAVSPILADAMERGTGRIECEVLRRPYLHLSTLVGTA